MAYRKDDLLVSTCPAASYVFRVARECEDLKRRKRLLTPKRVDRKPDHCSLSGFWCREWPLGVDHICIPEEVTQRAAMLAFDRAQAREIGIPCTNDHPGHDNHVDIRLPRFGTDEYDVLRDQLLVLLKLVWADCDPPVDCPWT